MAHPDKTRGGSEKGQRLHAGQTSRYSDAGMKARSQHGQRGGEDTSASGGTAAAGARSDKRQGETAAPAGARRKGKAPRG